ncbi:MAG: M23 family metallopeptidase [Hydrococcus sp. RM1_1_31]|nr:M23 family metallopeptidase [Hydrococcus sp. RM1_1_31]
MLTNTIESEGKAEFGLYARFCMYIFGYRTCTPYAYGPVPWFPFHETDLIPLGFGGTTSGGGSSSPGRNEASSGDSSSSEESGEEEEEPTGSEEDCTTYKGVNTGALKSAIANIESRGSGDYIAVGKYVQVNEPNGKINRGRALGKYQYMSYREEVRAIFAKKEGGLELLKRIENNAISQSELQGQLSVYFSQQEQEQVREQDFKNLLNRAYNLGDRDSKLVYRLGGWHYAGTGGFNEAYATRAEAEYKKELGKSQQKCQQKKQNLEKGCTGKYIHPAPGYPMSGQGGRFGACRPLGRCDRNHEGLDFGTPLGTSIRASDSGQVSLVDPSKGGYGKTIDIDHCGKYTTRYAHLSEILVKQNQTVSQGDIIAKSGATGVGSGAHLHFEIRVGGSSGQPLDPEKILKQHGQL